MTGVIYNTLMICTKFVASISIKARKIFWKIIRTVIIHLDAIIVNICLKQHKKCLNLKLVIIVCLAQ